MHLRSTAGVIRVIPRSTAGVIRVIPSMRSGAQPAAEWAASLRGRIPAKCI